MGTLLHDLRYGVRLLAKNPGFTAVAALSLGLGIGANTTIFTLVNAVLLHPLPVADSDRLVSVFTTDERNTGQFFNTMPTSRPNFEDYRDKNTVFEGMAVYQGLPMSFSGQGEPVQIGGEIVSGNFFSLLGVKPFLGRGFTLDEDKVPGERLVAVLSHNFWQDKLGSDPEVVGKTITLNGNKFAVIGVAPA